MFQLLKTPFSRDCHGGCVHPTEMIQLPEESLGLPLQDAMNHLFLMLIVLPGARHLQAPISVPEM